MFDSGYDASTSRRLTNSPDRMRPEPRPKPVASAEKPKRKRGRPKKYRNPFDPA